MNPFQRPISRRQAAAMAAAGVALVTIPVAPRKAHAADDLTVFDWTGYEIPELHQPYIAQYGASPPIAMYADTYEAFEKVRAGYRPDIMHPNVWDVRRFFDAGLLQPWEPERLAHWADIFPELQQFSGTVQDGKQYMIPTDWGINSICYRTDLVENPEESWNILWDPKYAGKLSMNTEMDLSVQIASLLVGVADPFHATEADIAALRAKLTEQRPLLRFYWSDPTELEQAFASGEVVAAVAWPAIYSSLKKQGQPVAYMNPKEGVWSWLTGFVRVKDAPGKEQNAYDYVDAWLAPETGKWMIENYGYGHTNHKSFDLVDPAVLEEKGLGAPDVVLKAAHATREYDPTVRDALVQMYEEVRSGG